MDIRITMAPQDCGAAGSAGDTVCLERAELQDLLRRVRGLERMIGRVLGAKVLTGEAEGYPPSATTPSSLRSAARVPGN